MPIDKNRNREILTIKLEQGVPISVDWSPDGTRLAVGDSFNGIDVLTAEGKRLWRREEHSNKIYCARWAPNGFLIASASYDKTVLLYDADTGKIILRGNAGFGNNQVTWSPDSTRLAWAVEGENQPYCVRIFDAATGQSLTNCYGSTLSINCLLWSPKGNILASGSEDYTINLFDSISGSCLHVLEGHHDFVDDLCWSPDGSLLASASNDNTIRIWNTASGKCISVCKGHEGNVDSISWSTDGRLIASGSGDNSARLWYAADLTELLKIDHIDWVNAVAFSPDGSRLATACSDGCLRLFDISDFVHEKNEAALNVALQEYIALQAATIGFLPPTPKAKIPPWVPHLPEAEDSCLGVLKGPNTGAPLAPSVEIFPDGMAIATGHPDGLVRRWQLKTGRIIWESSESHNENISDISISQDGKYIASSSNDSTIRIWDSANGHCLKKLQGHKEQVMNVCWSPDGNRLASIQYSQNKQIRIWNTITEACIYVLEGHETWGRGISWSMDGRFLSSWDDRGYIRIWDPGCGKCLNVFHPYNNGLKTLCWSPDNTHILTGYHDGKVLLVNASTGLIDFHYDGHPVGISTLNFSPDGKFFASGADVPFIKMGNQTIYVSDASTGEILKKFHFNEEGCRHLSWSPCTGFIVSSHDNDTIRIWDTRDLLENKTAKTMNTVNSSLNKPFSKHVKQLPSALAQMHRLNIFPPISLLRDMLDFLANRCSVESLQNLLSKNSGIQALQDLHWPFEARLGLVALLLHNYSTSEWKPPSGATPSQIRNALMNALTGEPIEPQPPAPPISLLTQAAEIIDDRLLSLLTILGPEAVAADPGLPLRILPRVKEIPPLSITQRRQLGIRISTPGISGQSTGLAPGADRGQIGDIQMGPLRIDFTSLLPTQLALPPYVQMYRHLRNELLFRAREMAEPPRMRPAVILLDVSPSTFGPIEKITRLAAFTVAQSLRRAGLPAILLTNSDGIKEGQWLLELKSTTDLVEIWLQRTLKTIPASRSLELARVLRAGMQENDGLEPIILVLSHPWFGADEEIPPIKHMRGLFVQFPNYKKTPALSDKCEKYHCIETSQLNELIPFLAQLLT